MENEINILKDNTKFDVGTICLLLISRYSDKFLSWNNVSLDGIYYLYNHIHLRICLC